MMLFDLIKLANKIQFRQLNKCALNKFKISKT